MKKSMTGMVFILILIFTSASWGVKISSMHKKDISKEEFYTIRLHYPSFKDAAKAENLNNLIQLRLDEIVKTFKKNIDNDPELVKKSGLPHNVNSNTLTVNYKITYAKKDLVSIRFAIDTYYYASAHPMTNYQSINYDLAQRKELTLNDIFKETNYLVFLSNFSKKVLTKKLTESAHQPTEPAAEGIKPEVANFKVWNLTPNGLLLTFPPYQVAAYVFGEQEVLIPYRDLRNKLRINFNS